MAIRLTLSALVCVAALAVAGCGGGTASREDYQADVVEIRDRVDSALAYITEAQSREELLTRMDDSANSIDLAADDLADVETADGFEDESDQLVGALRQLSVDIGATAEQIRQPGFGDLLSGTQGLSFESWTAVNRLFGQLRQQGIQVPPLERH